MFIIIIIVEDVKNDVDNNRNNGKMIDKLLIR